MLNPLGVGFGGFVRRPDRKEEIDDEAVALARALRHRLAGRHQEHPAVRASLSEGSEAEGSAEVVV